MFSFNGNESKIPKLQLIKNYIQKYSLEKAYRANKRDVLMANFYSIKTIGLLSNPKNEAEMQEVDKVIKQFEKHNKKTFSLIYLGKQTEKGIFTKNNDWTSFSKKNCSWYGKPKKDPNLIRFVNQEFDILIDLSFSKKFSLQSIFVQSKARLKIMPTCDLSKEFADLMLETSNPQNKLAFAKELIHYLKIINKDLQ